MVNGKLSWWVSILVLKDVDLYSSNILCLDIFIVGSMVEPR